MVLYSILLHIFAGIMLRQSSIARAFVSKTTNIMHHLHPTNNLVSATPILPTPIFADGEEPHLHTTSFVSSYSKTQLPELNPIKAFFTKVGMIAFITSMCIVLPITLFPIFLLHKMNIISTSRKQRFSLNTGQFCCRLLMRIIPFVKVKVFADLVDDADPEPSIWVCNHTSMLDIFIWLATDIELRGRKRRPIKIIYKKELEKNPITALLFKMCGFLPVDMKEKDSNNAVQYRTYSFKALLKGIKKAFEEGWDIGILPEGQVNPCPEKGLQHVFPGAFTMSKMSCRPIHMIAFHGLHKLWHGDKLFKTNVTGRDVKVRSYPIGRKFNSADEFIETFKTVVGHFGAKGEDHPEWQQWINGSAWKEKKLSMEDASREEISVELE